MALDQYLAWVRGIVSLTPEQEHQLVQQVERGKAERAKACPDAQVLSDARQARNELVQAFQPLVLAQALRWQHSFRRMELLDLVQEATLAVMEAIEANDATRGYRLAPLLKCRIRDVLRRLWCERDGLVYLPRHVQSVVSRVHRVEEALRETLGRAPSLAEIAAEMQVAEGWLRERLEYREQTAVTSWEQLVEQRGDDWETCLALVPLGAEPEMRQTLSPQMVQGLKLALEEVLTPRQREIIERRFGFREGGYQTQEAVAEALSIRRNGLQKTESKAKARLREILTAVCNAEEVA